MPGELFTSHNAPFGEKIPNDTPHAVSVSLPTLREVGWLFAEQDPEPWKRLETIYPRFGDHPLVQRAIEAVREGDENRTTVALSSPNAANQVINNAPSGYLLDTEIDDRESLTFLSFYNPDERAVKHVRRVMKRLGGAPSSRRAEDFLRASGLIEFPFEEITNSRATQELVARELQGVYGPKQPEVFLANSGMSAILSTVDALDKIRNRDRSDQQQPRDTWVRLGSIYHDTSDLLLDKTPGISTKAIKDVQDITALTDLVKAGKNRIAAVITEAPTNPLVEVPDLEEVKEIIGDIPLVVDVTTAGSVLVDALPHADVVVESLTKFASGHGDLMMGTVAVNPTSPYCFELNEMLPELIEPPYKRDIERIAYELTSWRDRAVKTGKNVLALAEFFEGHKGIERVFWSGSEKAARDYSALVRQGVVPAGVITIETKDRLEGLYDNLDLSKGPSFGTYFTLNTAYTHITHPHEIDLDQAVLLSQRTGLNPRMLRVSVGTEQTDWLIGKYRKALAS